MVAPHRWWRRTGSDARPRRLRHHRFRPAAARQATQRPQGGGRKSETVASALTPLRKSWNAPPAIAAPGRRRATAKILVAPRARKPPPGAARLLIGLGVLLVVGVVAGVAIWKWPSGHPDRPTAPGHHRAGAGQAAAGRTVPGKPPDAAVPGKPPDAAVPGKPPPVAAVPGKPVCRRRGSDPRPCKMIGGKQVYDKLFVPVTGDVPATFLLLRSDGQPNRSRFTFWNTKPGTRSFKISLKKIRKIDTNKWKGVPPTAPAFNLTFEEAERVAKWFGGRIPSAAEWDFAAGFTRAAHQRAEAIKRDAIAGEHGLRRRQPAENPQHGRQRPRIHQRHPDRGD